MKMRPVRNGTRGFVWAVLLLAMLIWFPSVPARAAAAGRTVWARLELVENSAEGPAYDRCELEATLDSSRTAHWRYFFGEARADSNSGWAAIRSGSGCAQAGSERTAPTWTLRGSPYFLVDVALGQTTVSGHEVLIEAALSVQKLTGFSQGGAPAYETTTQKRTLRAPEGGSAVIPILVANPKETEEFQVRELLLRFRASATGSQPPVEYGEVAVAADVPRAEIFLDGGFVGRTSSDGPVTLAAVRLGEREVVVRDASGREARGVAKVEKGRRASISLTLMKASPASPGGLRPLGPNPQGAEEFWRERDGAIVVRVPGGEFQMGSPDGTGEPSEHPQHRVRLNGFLMDKTEVTWGQYQRFLKESKRPAPKPPISGTSEVLPVSNVTWNDSSAFCAWAGGRLPTEAEWERAARGDDSRTWPWGNDWVPWRCNTRDGGPHRPTPAGSYPDCGGPYGVLDLAGSVREWCSDWFDETYYARSPVDNPKGPETGKMRVSRGGDWMTAFVWNRGAVRQAFDPGWATAVRGFRCVQDDPGGAGK
jgi:formylglycine-generating enzyme required for sulfatase activity